VRDENGDVRAAGAGRMVAVSAPKHAEAESYIVRQFSWLLAGV
jgi:hypothetical protein